MKMILIVSLFFMFLFFFAMFLDFGVWSYKYHRTLCHETGFLQKLSLDVMLNGDTLINDFNFDLYIEAL